MGRWAGYAELLRNRRYLAYEVSAVSAAVGYSFYALAIPWLAFEYSHSLAFVGIVLFAEYGVYAFTFVVAPWVDRARDKRTVYLLCYPVQAVAALALAVLSGRGELAPAVLLVLVVALSVLWDAAWAANNITPRLLLSKDQLFRAQGFAGLLGGATQIVAYAVGAAVLFVVGPSGSLLLYAALLVAAAAAIATVRLPAGGRAAPPDYWAEFRAGWSDFFAERPSPLLGLGAAELVRGFFTAAPVLLITLVAGSLLGGSVASYGVLFAASVIGGILTGVVLGEANPRRSVGKVLLVAVTAEGAGLAVAVDVAHVLLPAAALWFAIGSAGAAYSYALYAYLQGAYPVDRLGRITANLYVFTGCASGVGALVLGFVASRLPPLEFGLLVGVGLLAAGAVLAANPRTRRLVF